MINSGGHNSLVADITSKFDRTFCSKSNKELLRIENEFLEYEYRPFSPNIQSLIPDIMIQNNLLWFGKLKHYEGPTRFVDWSMDPYVALFFLCYKNTGDAGEIWAFDHNVYVDQGEKQWRGLIPSREEFANIYSIFKNTQDKTIEQYFGYFRFINYIMPLFFNGKEEGLFSCVINPFNHTRIKEQEGIFSISSSFGTSHANAISKLLGNSEACIRYIVPYKVVKQVEKYLKEKTTISEETLGLLDDKLFEKYVANKTNEIKDRNKTYLNT